VLLPRLLAIPFAALIAQQAPAIQVSMLARSIEPGELVVLTMDTPEPADAVQLRAFDRDWRAFAVDEDTWRVVLGIDLDVRPGDYEVAIHADLRGAGALQRTEMLSVSAKTFPTRRLSVDPDFVNPPASVRERIAQEADELGRLWQSSGARPLWEGPFAPAVPHAANSAFGARSVFNGEARSAHSGADFGSPAGTPVKAPAGGRVLLARDLYYSGQSVMIDHGAGVISLFAHLSSIAVAPDAVVTAGQVLGTVGATGRVTAAHLHWTVRASGARVDPLALLHVLGAASAPGRPPR
jgi:murein DD-endopeptidase MepM/ murein hydrolase activator NlpD